MGLIEASNIFKNQEISIDEKKYNNLDNKVSQPNIPKIDDNITKEQTPEKPKVSIDNKEKTPVENIELPMDKDLDNFKSFINSIKPKNRDLYNKTNIISLFDYGLYYPINNNIFSFIYSCSRFEVLLRMKNMTLNESQHKFPIFNFRIYFQKEFSIIAEGLLNRKFDAMIKRGNLIRVYNFPVIINNDTLYFVQDDKDDLYTEYVIRMMIEKEYPDIDIEEITKYQSIKLKSYNNNELSEIEYFDSSVHNSLVAFINSQFSGSITKEYDNTDMCKHCYFKSKCEEHKSPLPLN